MVALCACVVLYMSDEEGPTPVRAFLAPINMTQYRDELKTAGYDEISEIAKMSEPEVADMKQALLAANIPTGHVGRMVRAVEQLRAGSQASETQNLQPHPPPQQQPVPPTSHCPQNGPKLRQLMYI